MIAATVEQMEALVGKVRAMVEELSAFVLPGRLDSIQELLRVLDAPEKLESVCKVLKPIFERE